MHPRHCAWGPHLGSTSSPLLRRPLFCYHLLSRQAALLPSALKAGWDSHKKSCRPCTCSWGSPGKCLSCLSLNFKEVSSPGGPSWLKAQNLGAKAALGLGVLSLMYSHPASCLSRGRRYFYIWGEWSNFLAAIQALNGSLCPTSSCKSSVTQKKSQAVAGHKQQTQAQVRHFGRWGGVQAGRTGGGCLETTLLQTWASGYNHIEGWTPRSRG